MFSRRFNISLIWEFLLVAVFECSSVNSDLDVAWEHPIVVVVVVNPGES